MGKRKLYIWGGVILMGLVMAAIGFWFEPRSLTIKALDVETPAWPQGTAPLRVVLLSDIHTGGFHMPPARIIEIARRANVLHPDMIVLAGDYIGGDGLRKGDARLRNHRPETDNAIQEAGLRALGELKAPLGVYAVMGNHDCYWDCGRVRTLLAGTPVRLLENRSIRIARPGGDIWVVGIEDGQTQQANFSLAAADVPAGAATLTVEHNPGLFDWPSNHAAIQLSGHTHAGQVRLPLLGAPIRMSRHTEDTAKGWTIAGDRILIVTRGLGESGLPVRFGAAPQIMILTIRPGPKAKVTALP